MINMAMNFDMVTTCHVQQFKATGHCKQSMCVYQWKNIVICPILIS
jgi:hypothetical protein